MVCGDRVGSFFVHKCPRARRVSSAGKYRVDEEDNKSAVVNTGRLNCEGWGQKRENPHNPRMTNPWQVADCRKRNQGSCSPTKTSGQNAPGEEEEISMS